MEWFNSDGNRWLVAKVGLICLGVLAVVMLFGGLLSGARADGIAKRSPGIKAAAVTTTARRSWTGIYGGGFGGYATGELSGFGPVGLSATGPTVGVNAGITVQTGQIVWGAEVAHAWFFGNLKDVGVEREIEYTGRVGVLLSPQALLYGHGSFAQLHTNLVGQVDGWKFGPGVELKLPGEGWSIDLRGGYAIYDIDSIAPTLNANMLWGRVGLVKRFDLPAGWLGQ